MFWERFYNLCLRNGKRPNPVGKEIGLARYFNVSTDYLLGLSPYIQINGELVEMEYTDLELKKQIDANIALLNNKGIKKVAEYSKDLVCSANYPKEEEKTDTEN